MRRAKSVSIETTIEELAPYMRDWRGYFVVCETPEVLVHVTRWVRLRLRAGPRSPPQFRDADDGSGPCPVPGTPVRRRHDLLLLCLVSFSAGEVKVRTDAQTVDHDRNHVPKDHRP